MMDLMNLKEVAEALSLPTTDNARKLMLKLGVRPYDLGVGRGRGLRYSRQEIEEALERTRTKSTRHIKRPKPTSADDYFSRSYSDARGSLTGKGPTQ